MEGWSKERQSQGSHRKWTTRGPLQGRKVHGPQLSLGVGMKLEQKVRGTSSRRNEKEEEKSLIFSKDPVDVPRRMWYFWKNRIGILDQHWTGTKNLSFWSSQSIAPPHRFYFPQNLNGIVQLCHIPTKSVLKSKDKIIHSLLLQIPKKANVGSGGDSYA